MTDVRRFTTDYISVEDRIRLSVERNDGSVQVLWLTRPLLNKLVKQLLGLIEASPLPGEGGGEPIKETAHQRFNQKAAEAAVTRQKPVRAEASAKSAGVPVLVTSINLRRGEGVLHVDFKGGRRVLQSIPFSKAAIRQWLGMVHRHYCQAGWGGDFWPDWISSGQAQGVPVHLN